MSVTRRPKRSPLNSDQRELRRRRLPEPPQLLGGLTVAQFLHRYWQKQPLLIRQALPGFRSFLTPEELADLACKEGINSRLVIEKGGERPWQVKHGPLTRADFRKLPRTHWTLLVTDIDKALSPGADLLEHFSFIPNWRIDDLMISYATKHGSVGPHVDSYDVFLLQAQGQRRWQISKRRYGSDDLVPNTDLQILADFRPQHEWVLVPGDILYLPPGIAHHGVASEDCMTYSIGFRAPAYHDMLSAFAEHYARQLDPELRYTDPDLEPPSHPGEIDLRALRRVREVVRKLPRHAAQVDAWFGRFITETGPWGAPAPPRRALTPKQFRERLEKRAALHRSNRCRFAYIRQRAFCTLFVDGQAFPLDSRLAFAAPLLCNRRQLPLEALRMRLRNAAFVELLCDLYNKGYVSFGR